MPPDPDLCVPLKDHLLAVMDERDAARDKALVLRDDMIDLKNAEYDRRIGNIEKFQAKLVGVGAVLILVAGALGALIDKMVGG